MNLYMYLYVITCLTADICFPFITKINFLCLTFFSQMTFSDLWKKLFSFNFSVKQLAFYFKMKAVYSFETSLTFTI